MKSANEKTTLYLDPRVKRSVQLYALRDRRSLSDIVNQKLVEYLEEKSDIAAVKERQGEPTESLEDVVKALGFSLDDIRREAQKERRKGNSQA